MEKRLIYYLYAFLLVSIIGQIFILLKLSGNLMMAEIIILAISAIVSGYIVYNFESEKNKAYLLVIIFFSLLSVYAIIIYFMTKIIDALFLGLLDAAAIYLVNLIIPDKIAPPRLIIGKKPVSAGQTNITRKAMMQGIEPLRPMQMQKEEKKPSILLQELEAELKRAEEKNRAERKGKPFDFEESNKKFDDEEIEDDSEIFIEEIKPKEDSQDLPKTARKHIGKRLQDAGKTLKEQKETLRKEDEEDERLENLEKYEEIIQALRPIKDITLHHRKQINGKTLKEQKAILKKEDEEDERLENLEKYEEIIQALRPIKDITLHPKRSSGKTLREQKAILKREDDEDEKIENLEKYEEILQALKPIKDITLHPRTQTKGKTLKEQKTILKREDEEDDTFDPLGKEEIIIQELRALEDKLPSSRKRIVHKKAKAYKRKQKRR